MDSEQLKFVAIPALRVVLEIAFDEKGDPLTEEEVLIIRGRAVGMMMSSSRASEIEKHRGPDIDFNDPWPGWSQIQERILKQRGD